MAEVLPYVPPYAHILFCEDIRHEQNGQATFVGVFRNHILSIAASPPIQFPQINASIQIILSKTDPLDSIEVRMEMGEQVLQSVVFTKEQFQTGLQKSHGEDPEASRHFLSIEMKAVPLQILESTNLLVRVFVNGAHLNHSALRFRFHEDATPEE